jgi:NADPH2:quinone reductase
MTTMKAFAIDEYKPSGKLDHLKETEVPKPSASGNDLLVKVKAVATNPIDYKKLANLGDHEAKFEGAPLVVGWDGSGVVEAVGDKCSLFKAGDEVFFAGDLFRPGCFADFVVIDERIVAKKPKNLSWSQAAAEPLTTLTAWEGMTDQLAIPVDPKANAGKVILITGGAGGVATIATQIAKKILGLTVIATGSRPETINYIKEQGADHVINHHEPFVKQVNDLGFTEVDYVFDCHGLTPELFTVFIEIVKPFGGICSIWPATTVDVFQLFFKSIKLSSELMFTRPGLRSDASLPQHHILTKVAAFHDSGVLKGRQNVNKPLTVENLRNALELQASGGAIGKTTLYFEE